LAIPAATANTILIADDEAPIRIILRQVLETEGGLQFLDLFLKNRQELCLVVFDIKMPGRTGSECLNDVRQAMPNLPALMISGYDPDGPTMEQPDFPTKFMPKSFRIAEIKNAIYELRDTR
jgi:two-component system cell cycle sensor histidine kinase/response regulator CckA